MCLELIRSGDVFGARGRRVVFRLRPKRVAQFTTFPGAQTVQREPKRDANEPGAKACAVAQPIKPAVGAQQRFLSHIFGVRGIAQDAPRHAIGQRAALGEALLELAPRLSLGGSVLQLLLLVMCGRKTVVVMCGRKTVVVMCGRKTAVVMCGRKTAGRATWLNQNQLLHWLSCAGLERPLSPYN